MPESRGCDEVREFIPELAVGVSPGDRRASALLHIARCADCRAQLEDAARTVDELLLLAPEHEPPAGFEERVLAALGTRSPRHRVRTLLLATAVVVALLGTAAATRWVDRDARRLAEECRQALEIADGYLRVAELTASGPDGPWPRGMSSPTRAGGLGSSLASIRGAAGVVGPSSHRVMLSAEGRGGSAGLPSFST